MLNLDHVRAQAGELACVSLQSSLSNPFRSGVSDVAVIETRDLRKRYGRVEALRGVTLKVDGAITVAGP